MRAKKRINWAALSGVCIGIGVLVMVGVFVFLSFGKPKPVDPTSALPELSWVEPTAIRIGVVGSGAVPPSQVTSALGTAESSVIYRQEAQAEGLPAPTVVVIAAVPPPTAPSGSPTVPEPTATAATAGAPESANATAAGGVPTSATAATGTGTTDATTPSEPPPGAEMGVTYCGPVPCGIGLKCCCDRCVPFEEACDPRSCAAQSGLSISVPCGMDLCDPGEICCDARCGQCAVAGECPEETCN